MMHPLGLSFFIWEKEMITPASQDGHQGEGGPLAGAYLLVGAPKGVFAIDMNMFAKIKT